MKKNLRSLEDKILQELQNDEFARTYLNEALLDADPQIFLLALKDLYKARGKNIQTINKSLTSKSQQKFTNIIPLLHATGFSISVQPIRSTKTKK